MAIDWVAEKTKQKQIEEDVKKIREKQKQDFLKRTKSGSGSSTSTKKIYTGQSQSFLLPEEQTIKRYSTSEGVVGYEDPILKQSVQLKQPVSEQKIREFEQARIRTSIKEVRDTATGEYRAYIPQSEEERKFFGTSLKTQEAKVIGTTGEFGSSNFRIRTTKFRDIEEGYREQRQNIFGLKFLPKEPFLYPGISTRRYELESSAGKSQIEYIRSKDDVPLTSSRFYKATFEEFKATPIRLLDQPVATGATAATLVAGTALYGSGGIITGEEIIKGGLTGMLAGGVEKSRQEGEILGSRPAGEYAFFMTPFAVETVFKEGRGAYIKARGEYVRPEKVFDVRVLEGKDIFPMARSAKDALGQFKKTRTPYGEFEVATVTAESIPKEIRVKAMEGTEGFKGLEDLGLYVTPKGKASPYFTRIDVPLEAVSPEPQLKLFDLVDPQVLEITNIKGVRRYPVEILEAKGFEPVTKFLETTEPGIVYITKRSEIGFGSAKSQGYGGTTELEGIIPVGTELKEITVGKPRYTEFKGEVVKLREFEVTGKRTTSGDFIKMQENILKIARSSASKSTIQVSTLPSSILPSKISFIPKQTSSLVRSSVSSSTMPSYIYPSYRASSSMSYPASYSRPSSMSYLSEPSSSVVSRMSSSLSSLSRSSSRTNYYQSSYPRTPAPATLLPPFPKLPKLYLPQSSSTKVKTTGKAKTKYTPSVEALVFNIKTSKLTRSAKLAALTGLGVRPIKTR